MLGSNSSQIAESYSRRGECYASVLDPTLKSVVEGVIQIAGISGWERVLDLASGTGSIARATSVLGPWVIGVDFSVGIMTVAQRLSGPQIRWIVADAAALPFASQMFDLVTCGLSLSHLSDVGRSLREVRRVLRPGGRFIASSWGATGGNPSFSGALEVLKRYTGGTTHSFGEFLDESTWREPNQGRAVLMAEGFKYVRVTTIRVSGTYSSPENAFEWTFAWPGYGDTLDSLVPRIQTAIRREAIDAIRAIGDLTWEFDVNYYDATEDH